MAKIDDLIQELTKIRDKATQDGAIQNFLSSLEKASNTLSTAFLDKVNQYEKAVNKLKDYKLPKNPAQSTLETIADTIVETRRTTAAEYVVHYKFYDIIKDFYEELDKRTDKMMEMSTNFINLCSKEARDNYTQSFKECMDYYTNSRELLSNHVEGGTESCNKREEVDKKFIVWLKKHNLADKYIRDNKINNSDDFSNIYG